MAQSLLQGGLTEGQKTLLFTTANEPILQKTIKWQLLFDAIIKDQNDLTLIQSYDSSPVEVREQMLDENGEEYARLFLSLLGNIASSEHLQYVLALVDELLTKNPRRALLFLSKEAPFQVFQSILQRRSNHYTTAKAGKILASLLIATPYSPEDVTGDLLQWCSDMLRQADPVEISIALTVLQTLLQENPYRLKFEEEDGLNKLAGLIRNQSQQNFQLLYQAMHCLWLMSYNNDIACRFYKTTVITKIVDTIRQVSKEKVIRVGLATLRNLLDKGQNNQQMIEAGFMRVLTNLCQRNWGDEDMSLDMEDLRDSLAKNIVEMSSWDIYKKEILSENLEWSPVHKSERFWRENISKFENNKFELLGVLINLLRTSQNTLILSVACYDLGEFIRFHPRGRTIVQKLGAKTHIMKLMAHQDPEVQKHALMCVQKLMVTNWEYLSK